MLLLLVVTILQLLSLSSQDSPAPPAPILFLINSQPGGYHAQLADTSRQSLLKQWKSFVPASLMKPPQVLLTSEMDPEVRLDQRSLSSLFLILSFSDRQLRVDDLPSGKTGLEESLMFIISISIILRLK